MSAALLLIERARLYQDALPHGAYLDYLRNNGLGARSLANPDPIAASCGIIAVAAVLPTAAGGFEFADPAEPEATVAAVIEAIGGDGETVVDLVAWPINDPPRVRRMFGRADVLGGWNILDATTYTFGAPLRVWRTPLAWLQNECRGVVILDPTPAAWRLAEAPGRVSGEDRQHSAELAALVSSLFDPTKFVAPVTHLQEAA